MCVGRSTRSTCQTNDDCTAGLLPPTVIGVAVRGRAGTVRVGIRIGAPRGRRSRAPDQQKEQREKEELPHAPKTGIRKGGCGDRVSISRDGRPSRFFVFVLQCGRRWADARGCPRSSELRAPEFPGNRDTDAKSRKATYRDAGRAGCHPAFDALPLDLRLDEGLRCGTWISPYHYLERVSYFA
jgi:hypothetical protein